MDAVEGVFGDGRGLRFIARLLDGEAMSEVCRAFGISRKTGYKIFERYKEHGLEAAPGPRSGMASAASRARLDRSDSKSNRRVDRPADHRSIPR
jgi:transposase